MTRGESRYEEVSRRTFLKRTAAFGAAAAFGLAACSDDAATFAAGTASASAGTAAATTAADEAAATTTTEAAVTTTNGAIGSVMPTGAELAVSFTYAAVAGSGGPVRNPYVAVWVEDAEGDLVDTIALWFLQSEKGLRWLNELTRWYSVDASQQTISTTSGATRAPGEYSLVWDTTDLDGNPVTQGDYFICIESAREHGPYSLIREAMTLSDRSMTQQLTDDEELIDASIELTVA